MAQSDFLVANSPLFLLRKLRENPVVQDMAQRALGDTLLSQLKSTLSRKPKKISNAVKPYAYLVALSLQADPKRIEMATKFNSPYHAWYDYLARLIFNSTPSTTTSSFDVSRSSLTMTQTSGS